MCQVDLVAIASVDIGLDFLEAPSVRLLGQVRMEGGGQSEGRLDSGPRATQSVQEFAALSRADSGQGDQHGSLQQVILSDAPVVGPQADRGDAGLAAPAGMNLV